MSLFSFKKQKPFFTAEEQQRLVVAIRDAERHTSGEVRVFVESHCTYVDPVDRAKEIFLNLKMDATKDRNAVLFYIALKDQQLALFGDEGIYKRLGAEYWHKEVRMIIEDFSRQDIIGGICKCVTDIGSALKQQFPYEKDDKNELPDEIIFGK
ncbi:MAG: TPM domain-containing protein [Chitinophagaceae bacterium]|nr:TPM domain-containing protein [Chitinophagaceae bacterium]